MEAGPDDIAGTHIGHIQVIEAVGRGGMGEVYRGHNTRTNMAVAIKRVAPHLRSDSASRRRIIQEARAIAPFLKHPHIVGISDVVESDQELFLIMEWIDGPNLRRRMQEKLSAAECLAIITQCAGALRSAHERGIIHRDIKPENIMLTAEGTVRVCDFGLAASVVNTNPESTFAANASTAPAIEGAGTPGYFAPETLLRGEYGPQSDIFALGIVFYELLTSAHPFKAETIPATYDRILHDNPEPPSKNDRSIRPALDHVVLKMLAKTAANRYANVDELVGDLESAASELQKPSRPMRMAAAGIAVVLSVYFALNLPEPIRRALIKPPLPSEINLAVLPFALSNASADSALADGLTEALTTNLSKLHGRPNYQIVPAAQVRSRAVDTPVEARQEFGSTLALASTFTSQGNLIQISYVLVDTKNSAELRKGATTGTINDPFQLQDRVTEDVLGLLSVQIEPSRRAQLQRPRTTNPEAELANRRGHGYMQSYGRLENTDKAIDAFQEALSADSQYAPAYAGLGEAYFRKFSVTRERRWLEQASGTCAQAAKLDPKLSSAFVCLGLVESAAGQYEQAATEFRTAFQLDPQSSEALNQLAKTQENLGDVAGAEETHKRSIALQRYHWAGYAALGEFYNRQHRYAESITQWQYAIALSGDNGQAYTALGAAYIGDGQYDGAIRTLERAVVIRPHWDSYSNLGMLYMRLKRYPEAANALERAAAYGHDYRVTGNLARIYRIVGNTQKARQTYDRAILEGDGELSVNPRNPDVHILMARYYAYAGRKPEALIHVEFALALKPMDEHYLEIAAGVYDQVGERDKAVQALRKAFEMGLPVDRLQTEIELAGLQSDPRLINKR